jgi:hypothetical protein
MDLDRDRVLRNNRAYPQLSVNIATTNSIVPLIQCTRFKRSCRDPSTV